VRPNRLLLCTDMDRTVIPNGRQAEHPAARELFRALCRRPEVQLVYVTGRHRQLVEQAIRDYRLPEPAYAITDVGSRICRVDGPDWQALEAWETLIGRDWRGRSRDELARALAPIRALTLQEAAKQSRFKLSYYLPLGADHAAVLGRVREQLERLGVAASLTWSIDEPAQVGLLDVLPESASKLSAIEFLQRLQGYAADEVLFAGDSGNDLPVLGSRLPAVLVANASDEVREQARRLAGANGCPEALYLADAHGFPLGGDYAAGVLQGLCHFHPGYRALLAAGEADS